MGNGTTKQEEYRRWTGRKVAYYRKLAVLTQAQLARLVPCSTDQISRIERGVQDPTFQTACLIASRLGITPNELCPAEILVTHNHVFFSSCSSKTGIACTAKSGIVFGMAVEKIMEEFRCLRPTHRVFEERLEYLIAYCSTPRSRQEMMDVFQMKSKSHFRDYILYPLLKKGFLQRTIPDKPSSPDQRYYLVIPDEVFEEIEAQLMRQKKREELPANPAVDKGDGQ